MSYETCGSRYCTVWSVSYVRLCGTPPLTLLVVLVDAVVETFEEADVEGGAELEAVEVVKDVKELALLLCVLDAVVFGLKLFNATYPPTAIIMMTITTTATETPRLIAFLIFEPFVRSMGGLRIVEGNNIFEFGGM